MKKITILISIFVLGITLFTSCSKDAATTTSAPSASGLAAGKSKISFDYSGAASGSFTSNDLVSTALKNSSYGNISGGAVSGTSADLMMFLLPLTQSGTVNFKTLSSSALNTVTFSQGSKGWAVASGGDFSIVITKNDGATVEATFSGKLVNDNDKTIVTISNGKLAAKY